MTDHWEIHLTRTTPDERAVVIRNGEILDHIQRITIDAGIHEATTVTVTFVDVDVNVEVDDE